jgi:hypothetical protein
VKFRESVAKLNSKTKGCYHGDPGTEVKIKENDVENLTQVLKERSGVKNWVAHQAWRVEYRIYRGGNNI